MRRVLYLAILGYLLHLSSATNDENNITVTEVPVDTLVNLTANNELWTMMLKDCQKPSLTCVQNNMYKYLRKTLDESDDIQFTSYLRFTKNHLDYDNIQRSLDLDSNSTDHQDDDPYEDESPIESMSRSLQDNAARFLMTHDVELSLPDTLFPNSVLKISPRGFQNQGTLLNVQIVPEDIPTDVDNVGESRTIKKIQKFISEKLIYAIIAILVVIKLLAVKFLFILPLIVGAATAKKLLLKILLFIFPALHHLFKFCAYYPIQAKYHHHKHLISHIHQVAPTKYHYDHHEGIEIAGPHSHGPPIEYEGPHDIHHTEFDDDITVLPDDGSGFPHGALSLHFPNVTLPNPHLMKEEFTSYEECTNGLIDILYLENKNWPYKIIGIDLPIGYIAQPQQQVITPAPLPIANPPIQANQYHSNKVPQPHSLDSFPPQGQINSNQIKFKSSPAVGPPEPVYHKPVIQADPHGPIFKPSQLNVAEPSHSLGNSGSVVFQKSIEYDPRNGGAIIERRHDVNSMESMNENVKLVNNKITATTTKRPKIKDNDIYQAASITYDPFYTPILDKIDRILQEVGFNDEPCKERLVCSMYKNPAKYSPHSNLLSVQLSRDTSELPKPKSTNAAVIRFYKYVQAARDGQDQRDCLTLYPGCSINTDVS
ncbi:hypothetical protein GWI33_007064 [Rhynchophorus ferrugineus]|uniref:Uncharacterized protein n=1 Tax=Rhynchophorus ferrugineus TaxID=354439 RepID=A0A834IEU4_RHYFE|nr:hypothetical protein GWI33_007064 [Rhynchophorus ferrugineus]